MLGQGPKIESDGGLHDFLTPAPKLHIGSSSTLDAIRMVVKFIEVSKGDLLFIFTIHQAKNETLLIVETEATDRLTVIVIKQDRAVRLSITHEDTASRH